MRTFPKSPSKKPENNAPSQNYENLLLDRNFILERLIETISRKPTNLFVGGIEILVVFSFRLLYNLSVAH
jgi:hypothetical protein